MNSRFLLSSVLFCLSAPALFAAINIEAKNKTQDVASAGDAADDSAIYINQKNIKKSLIIGTDKKSGLSVYNLSGKRLQELPDGKPNNVDIRYNFNFGGKKIPLIAAGNRTNNTLDFYTVDDKNTVKRLSVNTISAGLDVYGACLYVNKKNQDFYFFVNSKEGQIIQWLITGKDGQIRVQEKRRLSLGSQVEGCVADEELNRFYVGEEDVGIWLFDAEPTGSSQGKLIDKMLDQGGHLVADVEGLSLYRADKDDGYLLASSQGENAFNIYDRKDHKFIGKFTVSYQGKQVKDCDGIEVSSNYLGKSFPTGMIVVQDGNQEHPNQSFKMVAWHDLALSFFPPLRMSLSDPILRH